jgi:hypothetical protein
MQNRLRVQAFWEGSSSRSGWPGPLRRRTPPGHDPTSRALRRGASHLGLGRFDLNGYVLDTSYTLGRNTANTFQQTYGHSMVQGVPIKGPLVGAKFPPEDYVAILIGHHELYVSWLDPTSFAIVDAFVMDFARHVVFDYAPGSAHPESAGTVTIVRRGQSSLP